MDLAWAAIVVTLLFIICLIFRYVWHGGDKPNGLKGELEERVTALENENGRVWLEINRLGGRRHDRSN